MSEGSSVEGKRLVPNICERTGVSLDYLNEFKFLLKDWRDTDAIAAALRERPLRKYRFK